jgi:Trk K+ transport system NAD-binding subunit
MRIIVIGAGGVTRDLLRRLGELWDVTVIDPEPELLTRAAKVRRIKGLQGDGSSRVVLERAGLADADALVAATGDDAVNLEVCRIAKEAGLLRLAAVAALPERLPQYRELGVPALSPHGLAARQLELNLEPRRISSTAFADGRAEAIEFRIAPDSPVRGAALKDIASETWLVAAVLRDGALIVPHGDTVLQQDDLVTVVGAATDYPLIVRTFTAGEARFPLDFGKRVAVVLESEADLRGPVAEAIALTRNSSASSVVLVHRRPEGLTDESQAADLRSLLDAAETMSDGVEVRTRPVDGAPLKALPGVVSSESVGVVVLPAPRPGFLARLRTVRMLRLAASVWRPVLFSRSSQPYHHIVAPARDTPSGAAAGRAAIDLAFHAKAVVSGVAAVAPTFLAGSDGRDGAVRALALLREEAAVQQVTVRRRLRQGNPVRTIEQAADDASLVVLGQSGRAPSIVRPGVVTHVVGRVPCSVLVVPAEPR